MTVVVGSYPAGRASVESFFSKCEQNPLLFAKDKYFSE